MYIIYNIYYIYIKVSRKLPPLDDCSRKITPRKIAFRMICYLHNCPEENCSPRTLPQGSISHDIVFPQELEIVVL